jgi:hypothetical protein
MKTSIRLIHWFPRICCIVAILFISMFAADAFAPGLNIWQQLGGFLIHLIPSLILIAVLIIAWKWEYIGGLIFMIIGIGMSPYVFMLNYKRNHFSVGASLGIICLITFPFIVIGTLFILSHFMKKRKLPKTNI